MLCEERVVEQHGVLRDDADRRAQAGLGELADVVPLTRTGPGLDIVEAVQQPRQRRLSRAGVADHCHRPPRWNLEVDFEQDGRWGSYEKPTFSKRTEAGPGSRVCASGASSISLLDFMSPNMRLMSVRTGGSRGPARRGS